jgi:CheY-like chemotaxis protein
MTELIQLSVSKRARLAFDLESDLPALLADPTQIRQVIMNLLTNASEALDGLDGRVDIRTGVAMYSASELRAADYSSGSEGRYVFVEVTDNGVGMDEAVRSRLFDPFFSTKFTGRGLGMAAVLGIVRGHKGAIFVASSPGQGTTFRVLFPASDCLIEAASGMTSPGSFPKVSGTVLLVDDEETVRTTGALLLEESGFHVVTARDGCEAVELFREQAHAIDCVLLDLTMPRLDGEETLRELRRIRGDVPVVLTSGYSAKELEVRFADLPTAGFLQKPFQLKSLVAILKAALRSTEGEEA